MLEDLEMEYFKIFNEFPNIFNWVDVTEEDKIKILKKCIDEKIEVDDCDLYINNYLEHISPMNQCEKCFYYKLCTQHDYITDNLCGIYEKGIPKEIWEDKKECEEFKEDILKSLNKLF